MNTPLRIAGIAGIGLLVLVATMQYQKVSREPLYFGADQNTALAYGKPGLTGLQTMVDVANPKANTLYLAGTWDFLPEYAVNQSGGDKITIRYTAKEVTLTADGNGKFIPSYVLIDGKNVPKEDMGSDVSMVDNASKVYIKPKRSYQLISHDAPREHVLELTVLEPGLKGFMFSFR